MDQTSRNPRHIVWATIIFIVLAVVGLAIAFIIGPNFVNWGILPPIGSTRDQDINQVLAIFSWLSIPVFALVVAFAGYSAFAFRQRGRPQTDGPRMTGSLPVQVTWLVISLVLVTFLFVYGLYFLNQVDAAPGSGALQVTVTGEQWLWDYAYPQYNAATSSELYLPVGREVNFTIQSIDVQHSFWIPSLGIKEDAVPGETNHISVTPTVIGDYVVRCAELCGVYHAYMNTPVHVVSQDAFKAWVAQQPAIPTATPASSLRPVAPPIVSVSDVVARRDAGWQEG